MSRANSKPAGLKECPKAVEKDGAEKVVVACEGDAVEATVVAMVAGMVGDIEAAEAVDTPEETDQRKLMRR